MPSYIRSCLRIQFGKGRESVVFNLTPKRVFPPPSALLTPPSPSLMWTNHLLTVSVHILLHIWRHTHAEFCSPLPEGGIVYPSFYLCFGLNNTLRKFLWHFSERLHDMLHCRQSIISSWLLCWKAFTFVSNTYLGMLPLLTEFYFHEEGFHRWESIPHVGG